MSTTARLFILRRFEDLSGVSGTGIVADGVEFPDGTVALRWRGPGLVSTALYENISTVEDIHGHEGRTKIIWVN